MESVELGVRRDAAARRERAPQRPRRLELLTTAVLIFTVGYGAAAIAYRALFKDLVPRWQAGQYWWGYTHGFQRRGLPGAVLRAVVGGSPSNVAMALTAIALSMFAGIAMVWLAVALARASADRIRGRLAAALVMASPFTVSLQAMDTGRYDAVGFVALVVTAGMLTSCSVRPWTAVTVAAVMTALAVASEEFLFAFLAPVVVIGVVSAFGDGRGQQWRRACRSPVIAAAVALAPGLVVAMASVLSRAPVEDVRRAVAESRAGGVDTVDRVGANALTALLQSPVDAAAFVTRMSVATRVLLPIGLMGVYLLCAATIWHLLGRPAPRVWWWSAAGFGVLAVALGFVGVDDRRWWALAFVALVAVTAVLARQVRLTPRSRWTSATSRLVVLALVVSLVGQLVPIYPSWERSLGSTPPPVVAAILALSHRLGLP